MTAGTEVVCSDVVRKVEIEDKCVAGLDSSDLNKGGAVVAVDCNVGGNGNVGGDGKDDSDESYVFVSGDNEVTGGDPADTGGVGVDASVIGPKSDSADDVEQEKKEDVGMENREIPVDPLAFENNGIVHESATVRDAEVQAVEEEVTLNNGSTVDSSVALETNGIGLISVDDHLDKITEEVVKRSDEVEEVNGMTDVGVKIDDIDSGVKFDPESTLNPTESSQVTVFESVSTIKPPEESESQSAITQSVSEVDVFKTTDDSLFIPSPVSNGDSEVTVNDGLESVKNLIDKAECQSTVDGAECHSTVDESESTGKAGMECQATADGSESSVGPIKEHECQVSVIGSEAVGSSVDNQECPVSVDGSESSGNHNGNIDSAVIVMESAGESEERLETSEINIEVETNHDIDGTKAEQQSESVYGKSEEHLETSEINAEAEANHECGVINAEHQSESVSTPYPFENKKAESTVLGSGTESEENPGSVMLSEAADAPTNLQEKKFDGVVEMGGIQMSGTEADEHVLLEFDAENVKSEEELEKQAEGGSEALVNITEAVEFKAEFEEMKEQVKTEDEIQESQILTTDNVQNQLNLEESASQSANEAEAPLEIEASVEPFTDETIASQYAEVNSCDKTKTGIEHAGSVEHAAVLPSTDSMESECKKNGESLVEDTCSPSNTKGLTVAEQKVEYVAHLVTGNSSAEVMDCGTGIKSIDVHDDVQTEAEVKDASIGDQTTLSFSNTFVNPVTVIEFGSFGHHKPVPNTHTDDVIAVHDVVNGETTLVCGANSDDLEHLDGSQGDRSSDKVSCPEVEDLDGVQSDEIRTSSVEDSVSDAVDVQNEEAEVLPYNFLVRIPRFEDEMLRDQIRSAQLQVDEKTRLRDAIRAEGHGKRVTLKAHNDAINAAKSEETAIRRLVKLKRQEIDSVQTVINRVKNAMSVEDIDARIANMTHIQQHETLNLKDEKQFIREIKQLKTLRDQLASNMGSKDEVQQALDQKDQTDERMKTLRKELDSLKDKVSKAEAAHIALRKKYDEEIRKEKELQAQFRAADDVRQKAYAHLNSLKKQSYDKNKNFRMYKEDVTKARDFASRGDKDSLHRLCANQVEAFMEQWNSNDEFRKEYVNRCNVNASRRQRALDGRSLGPDEAPPLMPPTEHANRSLVSTPSEAKSVSMASPLEDNQHADNKATENASSKKNQPGKPKGPVKPTEAAAVIVRDEAVEDRKEEEKVVSKEELEAARKAEELRKAEVAAKLKEQRRLEEKAKAIEALERKKRTAEKNQLKAELRARKEAELKEKEREKRLRKKEKKKAGGDGSINGEEAANSESSNEPTTKEPEAVVIKEKKKKPPPHFFSKQLKPKPVPPPIVNRNRKRWQQWGKVAAAVAIVLALFLLGNTGFFQNLRPLKAANGAK